MLEDMFDDDFFDDYDDPFKNDVWFDNLKKSKNIFGLDDMFWKSQNGRIYNKNLFGKEIQKKVDKTIGDKFNKIFESFELRYNNKLFSFDLVSDPGFSNATIGFEKSLSFQKYKEIELANSKDMSSKDSIYYIYVKELAIKYNFDTAKIFAILRKDDVKFDKFAKSVVTVIINNMRKEREKKELEDTVRRLKNIFKI